jgi:HEAT repeat protein
MNDRIGDLILLLRNPERSVAWRAVEALVEIGVPAVEALIRALTDSDETAQWRAARVLGKIGDVRAVEPLIEALKDGSSRVRQGAAIALCYLGDENSLPRRVLAQAGLLVEQRIRIIDALRRVQYQDEYRRLHYFGPDIETFCNQMLQDVDRAVREGAELIWAWLQGEILLRPTEAPPPVPEELMRPVYGGGETNPEELLRVADEIQDE